MRSATVQRANTMIPIGALQQAPEPHVSHAESGAFIKGANPQRWMTKLPLRHGVSVPQSMRDGERFTRREPIQKSSEPGSDPIRTVGFYEGQRCALLTTKSRNTCTRATVFNSSG
jgi:hypothetical protein